MISRRYHMSFRIDPDPTYDLRPSTGLKERDDAEREFRRTLYHTMGLKLYSVAWAETPLDDARLVEGITARVRDLGEHGVARFGDLHLFEIVDRPEGFEWYEMRGGDTGYQGDFNPWDYVSCRAYQFAPPPHFLHPHVGSERFLAVVAKHELTGLEALWVEDRGRYRAPSQWYYLIATEPVGHGLDHPWFDRDRADRRRAEQLQSDRPAHRGVYELFKGQELAELETRARRALDHAGNPVFFHGETTVRPDVLKDGWTTGSEPIDAMVRLALAQQSDFSLTSPSPHLLRAFLPNTDFAYWWHHLDGPNSEGDWTRWRTLMCSRRARDLLIEERVMRPGDFRGAIVWPDVPAGVRDLDADVPCPPPFRTEEELATLRKEEARRWDKHQQKQKPIRTPNLKRSLAALRHAKRDRPDDFLKGTTTRGLPKLLRGLPVSLPVTWRQVLKITRGGEFGVDDILCIVPDPGELLEFHRGFESFERAAADDYPTNRFYFARTDTGDHFAFELPEPLAAVDPDQPYEDLPVLHVDHETGEVSKRWTGVADFLESVLTA